MKKNDKGKLLPIEKLLITIIFLLGVFVPVATVFSQATLSKSNIELEKLKSKVTKQTNTNQSLSMQVDELASLSNIQDIAKEYGLSYNNDNIIVINN
jgi:cell division protein FtsL